MWPDGANASLEGLESPKGQPLEGGLSLSGDCRISWRPEAASTYLLSLAQMIGPRQQRRPHRQTYRRRVFFVLAFDVRLIADFDGRGGVTSYFLTSTTTSCHQCSAGPLSNPSSRPRVAANCRSWCQASQSARVFHVPTITRRFGLSDCRRSCPPTQPGRFFAADRRVRIAASHSGPAPSFRCTWVTIVIIELVLLGSKSRLILLGLTELPHSPAAGATAKSSGRAPSQSSG